MKIKVSLTLGLFFISQLSASAEKKVESPAPQNSPMPAPSGSPSPSLHPLVKADVDQSPDAQEIEAEDGVTSESNIFAPLKISSSTLPPLGQPERAEGPSSQLTLDQAVTTALKSTTEVLKAQNDLNVNGMLLLQAYAQFLPNLGSQASYSYLNGNTYFTAASPTSVSSKNSGLGYNVSSTFNIFNGFSDYSNLQSSLLKKESSELSLFRAKQQVILDTIQSFLQVILDNEIVKIAKKNLSLSQEREKLLEEQTRVGVRNLSDLFRQQAQTSADELFLVSSRNKERSDQILLLRKLRLDISKDYQLIKPKIEEGTPNQKFQNEMQLIQIGLEQRADLKASSQQSDSGHWDLKNIQGGFLPRLDFGVNVNSSGRIFQQQDVNGNNTVPSFQGSLFDQLGYQTSYTAALTLTFNIFDRWTTRLSAARSRTLADNLEIDAQNTRLRVEGEIRQAYGDYQTALQQLVSTKKGLEAAVKAYEVTQGRYEVGAASFVDLITAQTALVQSESNRVQSLIGFLLQEKTMDFVLGVTNVNL